MAKKDPFKLGRVNYVIECAVEYFISIMITGAFLAKLTTELGFSDSLTAILSSFVALGCSFQILSIFLFRGGSVRRRVTFLHILNQLAFTATYLIPFIDAKHDLLRKVLFIAVLLCGYFISNIIFSPKTTWFMSLVKDKKRGIFTSVKEMVSLIGGMLFQLCMGRLIDYYFDIGAKRTAFIVCAVTMFGMMILHTLTLVFSREKPQPEVEVIPLTTRFKNVLGDKTILKIIAVSVFWTICVHLSTSFLGTYQVKELGFSMTFVAVLNVLYSAVRIPFSFLLGRIADKYSFARMLPISYGLAAVGFLFLIFTVPSNGMVFYTIYHLLYAAAMGGANSADLNLIFDYVAPEKRSDALAIKQSVYGICGFLATLTVTPLYNYIQKNNGFFGLNVYPQQVLAALSFISALLVICYLFKVVLKIKPYQAPTEK